MPAVVASKTGLCRPQTVCHASVSTTASSARSPLAGGAGSTLAGVAKVLAAGVVADIGGCVQPESTTVRGVC